MFLYIEGLTNVTQCTMYLIFRNNWIFFSCIAKLTPPSNNNGTDYDYDDEYYEDYDYEPYDEIQANSTGITIRK